jgi:antitoxin HicB
MALAYRVCLEPDSDGSLLISCPALPEVTTFGDDQADAMVRARNAIEEALAARMHEGQDIPIGDANGANLARVSMLFALRVEIYRRRQRVL